MKLYYFSFDGVVLGGEAVVMAPNEEQALAELTIMMNKNKMKWAVESIELNYQEEVSQQANVVYFSNGDY